MRSFIPWKLKKSSFPRDRRWILGRFVGKVVLYSVFWTPLKNCGSASESGSLLVSGCSERGRHLYGRYAPSTGLTALRDDRRAH